MSLEYVGAGICAFVLLNWNANWARLTEHARYTLTVHRYVLNVEIALKVNRVQMCDPRLHTHFWDVWKDFEVAHGNEDTVREMLRIKRSVQATFNSDGIRLIFKEGKRAPGFFFELCIEEKFFPIQTIGLLGTIGSSRCLFLGYNFTRE